VSFDSVVLLGFGGPERREDVRPFLDRVLHGRSVPRERYDEVVAHYEAIGGTSPYNALTRRLAAALTERLNGDATVYVAYRRTEPLIAEVFDRLGSAGRTQIVAIPMAPHQSEHVDPYVATVEDAEKSLPYRFDVRYIAQYYDHPLFVEAHAQRTADALHALGANGFDATALVFSAHSVPQGVADSAPYVAQLQRSAELIAEHAGAPRWTLGYQSRSGSPRDPWLEPDVRDVLRALPARGFERAVVVPVGFVSDHVEVLYDLDVEAASAAAAAGVTMRRATGLNDHPIFVDMLAQLVREAQ